MKHKIKYSTTKISPAKINSSSGKALIKSPRLRKSQQRAKEVCQMYFMKLRSGLNIEKEAPYFRKETTKRHSSKTARKCKKQHLVLKAYPEHMEHLNHWSAEALAFDRSMVQKYATDSSILQERSFLLSTYKDQTVTFACADGSYEISVEDLGKNQKKEAVLFRYYDSQISTGETDDGVDGHRVMVSLSPTEDKDVLLHANNKERSVALQKCENPLPEQTFFLLHRQPSSNECVSFECMGNPGMFIGVKNNSLALIKLGDQTEGSDEENIIFKLS